MVHGTLFKLSRIILVLWSVTSGTVVAIALLDLTWPSQGSCSNAPAFECVNGTTTYQKRRHGDSGTGSFFPSLMSLKLSSFHSPSRNTKGPISAFLKLCQRPADS
ncbi:hypothetical protein BDW59DRAFT_41741 [Aspergillus cavernicola]|uniref:Secreted protein n=1 Tax=Aspergillus cavernicola TaxID=176166 RepID=A0ABR4IN20_9EURO